MDISHVYQQPISLYPPESAMPCFVTLLQRGISYLQEGAYAEAAAVLTLALEQQPCGQKPVANALRSFLQCYETYRDRHRTFLAMSSSFASAQDELKGHLATLETIVPDLEPPIFSVKDEQEQKQAGFPDQSREDVLQRAPDALCSAMLAQTPPLAELFVNCFGYFMVRRLNEPLALCSSRSGQGILRYLIAQPEYSATSDILQALFWPEDERAAAQRKLHTAISALRRSLHDDLSVRNSGSYIFCKNGIYTLNPLAIIHTDVDEFVHYYQLGQQKSELRIDLYEKACWLYTGPFLSEDIYADWSFLRREQLRQSYLSMCRMLAEHYLESKQFQVAAQWSTAILKENRLDEAAYCQLIRIYAAQGLRCEALQQFQRCEQLLREDLGVQPMLETRQVLQAVLSGDTNSVSP